MNSATIARVTPLHEPEPRSSKWLVAFPSPVYCAILRFLPLAVVRLLAERRIMLRLNESADPDPDGPADAFEHWVIERWLRDIHSEEFRASADYEYLRAKWERGEG